MRKPDEARQATLLLAAHLGRAAARLSHRERVRFERALEILEAGGGASALAEAGLVVAGPGVFEALLARAWAVRHCDAAEMLRLASTARNVAERLNPRYGERFVAGLQARAWGELANAFRIAGRYDSAAKALEEATILALRSRDRLLLAWVGDLHATLLGCSRQLPLALEALEKSCKRYERLGERHLAGRALLTLAVFAFAGGNPARALQLNEQARFLLDPALEPDLPALAAHNQRIIEAALSPLTPGQAC